MLAEWVKNLLYNWKFRRYIGLIWLGSLVVSCSKQVAWFESHSFAKKKCPKWSQWHLKRNLPNFLVSEVRLFDEWLQNRYGVFPDTGFPDGPMFPERYVSGLGQESKTRGCNASSYFGGIQHLLVNRQFVYCSIKHSTVNKAKKHSTVLNGRSAVDNA